MTAQLLLSEVIDTARQKLSSLSACLNDSTAFSSAAAEFGNWLSGHEELLSESLVDHPDKRQEIEQLIRQLTRLEIQAQYNISLVANMQGYIHGQLERTSAPQKSYNNLG